MNSIEEARWQYSLYNYLLGYVNNTERISILFPMGVFTKKAVSHFVWRYVITNLIGEMDFHSSPSIDMSYKNEIHNFLRVYEW